MNNCKKRFKIRAQRVRSKISKLSDRPRVTIYKSNKNIYAQIIALNLDSVTNTIVSNTIAYASTLTKVDNKLNSVNRCNKSYARQLGTDLGEKAMKIGISKVVLDRGGYKYHGIVKEFADALRACSLDF